MQEEFEKQYVPLGSPERNNYDPERRDSAVKPSITLSQYKKTIQPFIEVTRFR